MMCPRCQSVFLLVKERKGLERIRIALTGKRKYECTDCGKVFRIKDRRRFDRQANPDWDSENEHERLVGELQHGQRYTCIVTPVRVHSGGISEPFAAVVLEVSRSGLRIQAPRMLSVRDRLDISVHGQKEKPAIHAEVRFCRPNLGGGTYDIGLRITDT